VPRVVLVALVFVCLAVAAVAMVLTFRPAQRQGAPGSEAADATAQQFVGRWVFFNPSIGADVHVEIARADGGDGGFVVATVYSGPVRYRLQDDRLVPVLGSAPYYTISRGRLLMTMSTASPSPRYTCDPEPAQVQPTYTPRESQTIENLHAIQVGVQSWAVEHGDAYPPAELVTEDGLTGKYVDTWPTNPYTGGPMKQGTDPGDYTYLAGAGHFRLSAFDDQGRVFYSVP